MKRNKLENKLIDSVKKNNGGQLPDERQQEFNSMILTNALLFGVIFDSIMMIYYFAARNIDKSFPYVAQLLAISVGGFLASLGNKEAKLPTTFFSRRSVKVDKNTRAFFSRLTFCIFDALIFAVIISACDAYTDGRLTGSLVSDGIFAFFIFVLINVVHCEISVHRYRKHMAILDAEENDLDD